MNVLLINPAEPEPPVLPQSLDGPEEPDLSPPWRLLCLRSYLLDRTRHLPMLVDTRFFTDLETELVAAVHRVAPQRVALLDTRTVALGHVMAILDIIKRHFPEMPTVLCGQHPSQFPEQTLALPRVDYVLSGDPEPILRNLLDHFDVKPMLNRVPGLLHRGHTRKRPYWLHDLSSLTLPDWHGVVWNAYTKYPDRRGARVRVRLSRGHTRCPADRAFGSFYEPFRIWRFDRFAGCMQRATDKGIAEIFFEDPPGIWTVSRLDQWCAALQQVRNAVPWGLQLLPTLLSPNTVEALARTQCHRVVFLLPSCDLALLRQYGVIVSPRQLSTTMNLLREAGIATECEIWVGGPEEEPGEKRRVGQMLRELHFPTFTLHAFPWCMDAPLSQDKELPGAPRLEDWTHWARNPWSEQRPLPLWGGSEAVRRTETAILRILRTVHHHPWRVLRQGLLPFRLFGRARSKGPWTVSPVQPVRRP